jgi:hypothetical protein
MIATSDDPKWFQLLRGVCSIRITLHEWYIICIPAENSQYSLYYRDKNSNYEYFSNGEGQTSRLAGW